MKIDLRSILACLFVLSATSMPALAQTDNPQATNPFLPMLNAVNREVDTVVPDYALPGLNYLINSHGNAIGELVCNNTPSIEFYKPEHKGYYAYDRSTIKAITPFECADFGMRLHNGTKYMVTYLPDVPDSTNFVGYDSVSSFNYTPLK